MAILFRVYFSALSFQGFRPSQTPKLHAQTRRHPSLISLSAYWRAQDIDCGHRFCEPRFRLLEQALDFRKSSTTAVKSTLIKKEKGTQTQTF